MPFKLRIVEEYFFTANKRTLNIVYFGRLDFWWVVVMQVGHGGREWDFEQRYYNNKCFPVK